MTTAEETGLAFGTRLRERRKEKGLSQQELADRCYDEVTKSNISRLETNLEQRPTIRVIEVLARVLDWPIDEARQLAGYSPVKVEWSVVTASELVYVLENYPLLSEESRQFAKDQFSATIRILLKKEEAADKGTEQKAVIAPVEEIESLGLDNALKQDDSGKKKRKK